MFSLRRISLKIWFPTSDRRRVSCLRYMSRTTMHVDYDQANKLVLVFVLILGSKALYHNIASKVTQFQTYNLLTSSACTIILWTFGILIKWCQCYKALGSWSACVRQVMIMDTLRKLLSTSEAIASRGSYNAIASRGSYNTTAKRMRMR